MSQRLTVMRLFVLVMLPLIVLSTFGAWQSISQRLAALAEQRETLAHAAVLNSEAYLDGNFAALGVLARHPLLQAAAPDDRIAALFARELAAHPAWEALLLLDVAGWNQVVVGPNVPPAHSFNFFDRAHVRRALASGAPAVGDADISRGRGVPVVSVAVPVDREDGQRQVLLVPLSLERLGAELRELIETPTVNLIVVDAAGRAFIHPDPAVSGGLASLTDQPAVAAALGGRAGVLWDEGATGGRALTAFAPVPETGWAVLVREPAAAALDAVRGELLQAAALLLVIVASGVLAWYVGGRLAAAQRQAEDRRAAAERAQSEAEQAVRVRDEFMSIASHELRTPITAIKGSAQLALRNLERGLLDSQRLERTLTGINLASDKLAVLTADLLEVSRLQHGRLTLRLETLDLAGLLQEVALRWSEQADDGHAIVLALPPAPCLIRGDPVRLEQVLDNLLGNAVKYSPEGGEVTVTLGQTDARALVEIRDAGIGLPAGTTESIFEPFGRASNAQAQNVPGLGLGLYIVRQIVELHGGQIWAESDGEDQGTVMHLWLPCAAIDAEPPSSAREHAARPGEPREPRCSSGAA